MKVKSLALLLSLGLFAASASATSVVLYGGLDAAVQAVNTIQKQEASVTYDKQTVKATEKTKKWTSTLANGSFSGTFLGFKGQANITADSMAGFQLEMGLNAVDGSLNGMASKIFNRGAYVYVQGDFGMLNIGYMPDLLSGHGPLNAFASITNPFVNAGAGGNAGFMSAGRMVNNSVAYLSPSIAGLQFVAFFSPDAKNDGNSFKKNERLGQVGLTFTGGPVQLIVAGSRDFIPHGVMIQADKDGNAIQRFFATDQQVFSLKRCNSTVVAVGGNIALGDHVKVFASGNKVWKDANNMNGWGATVGASFSFGNNDLGANVLYQTAEHKADADAVKLSAKTLGAQLRYAYAFNKFAHVYMGANFSKAETKYELNSKDAPESLKVTDTKTDIFLGMSYKF